VRARPTRRTSSPENTGFKPVGLMREYWRDPDGVWRDGLLMDLLA
jgi:aminoglycoside 6'-N-acetyltransferase